MKMLNYFFLILFLFSFSSEVLSETRKMEYRCKKVPETGAREFSRFFDVKITTNGFDGEVKFFSKRRNKFFIQTFAGETAVSGNFEINSRILSEDRKPKSKQGFIKFDKSNQQNINLIPYLDKGVRATQGPRFCTLRLLPNKKKLIQKVNKRKELTAQRIEEERIEKKLAAKKAEEERTQKELAAQKAEEERKQQEIAAKKVEEERKQQEIAVKKAEEERKKKEIAAKKVEEERKQQEIAAKKVEEERKAQALAAKKAEEERKAKSLVSLKNKYKTISKVFIEDLTTFVKKPNNLDILKVGKLLANYNSSKGSGWNLNTVKAFDDIHKYVINDKKFKRFHDKNNRERNKVILKAKNSIILYLNNSLSTIKNYIGSNLGTDAANDAIILADKINNSLNKIDVKSAITLIEKINLWKNLNKIKDGHKLNNEATELIINIKAKKKEERKQKNLVLKRANAKKNQQDLVAKKAEEERKQQELASQKAKEEKNQQDLVAKKAEEERKQQEIVSKKEKLDNKQEILNIQNQKSNLNPSTKVNNKWGMLGYVILEKEKMEFLDFISNDPLEMNGKKVTIFGYLGLYQRETPKNKVWGFRFNTVITPGKEAKSKYETFSAPSYHDEEINLTIKPSRSRHQGNDIYKKLMKLRKKVFITLKKSRKCDALIKIDGISSQYSDTLELYVETEDIELIDCKN